MGEELLDGHFAVEWGSGRIQQYEWVAIENAISPFDFWLHPINAEKRKVEVKSTTGDFNQTMHVSMSELLEMSDGPELYDLYRVYNIDERTARLRIAEDVREFAAAIVKIFEGLPAGIRADGISVRPDSIAFGPERVIELPAVADLGTEE